MGVWFSNSMFYVLFCIHAVKKKKTSRGGKVGILCPNT